VAQGAYLYSADLLEHYDIIGLDPRGTGSSQLIECDPDLWNPRVSWRPQSDAEYDALVAHNKAFGESCREKTGPFIDHLDTIHVTKDIELVRQALGEEKLDEFKIVVFRAKITEPRFRHS
jgi:pimeloyl-ACP methyl ester carboxylesterase